MNGQNNNPNNNSINNVNNNQTNKVTPAQSKGESSLNQAQQNSQIDRDANAQKRNVGLQSRSANQKGNNNLPSKSSNNTNNSINNSNSVQSSNNQSFPQKKNIGDNSFKRYNNKISNTNKNSSKVANKAASTGLTASGVPKPLSDKIVNSKRGQSMMNMIKKRNPMIGLMDKAAKKIEGSDNESQEGQIDDEKVSSDESKSEQVMGAVDLVAVVKKYKWPIIVSISLFGITIFLCLMLAIFSDGTAAAGAFANDATDSGSESDWDETAEERSDTTDEEDTDEDVQGDITEESYLDDSLSTSVKFVAKEKFFTSEDIADYYGVEIACNGKKNKKCTTGTEYKFYLKMYDIYFLYKNQYGVSLDLPLIMATLNYGNEQMPVVFKNNINDYNREELNEDNYEGILSWEIDYKNLSGYKYLNANDFRYDMQILAKNMVTKKITYKCGDTEKEATDIEKSNYSKGLKCDNGTYDENSVSESYVLDMDKYDEFLLEYIEHKFFLKGFKVEETDEYQSTVTGGDASKLLEIAEKQLDQSNTSKIGGEKYWKFMGFSSHTSWCASFVAWCAHEAGISTNVITKSAAVDSFMSQAKSQKRFYRYDSNYIPKPGDLIIWDSRIKANPISERHIGIVKSYDSSTGRLATIEGNTTGNPLGAVNENHYNSISSSGAAGFFSPHYSNSSSSDKADTISNGKTIKLPSGLGSYATREFDLASTEKEYSYSRSSSIITDPYAFPDSTSQGNVQRLWIKKGALHDEKGFCKLDGRYLVAVTTTYGNVGDKIDAYLSNGKIIHAIIADAKSQSDPGCSKWGHDSGNNVLEFLGKSIIGDNPYIALGLKNVTVKKIVNGGSVL